WKPLGIDRRRGRSEQRDRTPLALSLRDVHLARSAPRVVSAGDEPLAADLLRTRRARVDVLLGRVGVRSGCTLCARGRFLRACGLRAPADGLTVRRNDRSLHVDRERTLAFGPLPPRKTGLKARCERGIEIVQPGRSLGVSRDVGVVKGSFTE